MTPMYCLPADDAPLTEWLRPVSALMVTRQVSFFSDDDKAAGRGTQSAMARRMNKTRRERVAKNIEASAAQLELEACDV